MKVPYELPFMKLPYDKQLAIERSCEFISAFLNEITKYYYFQIMNM